MTRLDCALQVNVPEVGDVELGRGVYARRPEEPRLLALRTANTLLNMNASTYVALDMERRRSSWRRLAR